MTPPNLELRIVEQYEHRCGQLVWMACTKQELIGFQDDDCNNIVRCPRCKRVLEWEDIGIPEMIKELGWPI